MNKEEITKFLQQYDEYINEANPIVDGIQWIGWLLLRFLVWLTDIMSNIAIDTLSLFGLLDNSNINNLLKDFQPVFIVIFAIAIMWIGFKLLTGRQVNKFEVLSSLILAIVVLGSINSGMNTASKFSKQTSEAITKYDGGESSNDSSKLGTSLLKKSIVDLQYLDREKWPKIKENRDMTDFNNLNADTVKYIDINEKLEQGDSDMKTKRGKELTKHHLLVNEDNEAKAEKLKGGFFGVGESSNYRFALKWGTAIIGLICTSLALFLAGVHVASIILETMVNKVLAVVFSFSMAGNQLKKTIQDILNAFVSIIMIFLMIWLYKEVVGFLANQNLAVWIVGMVAATKFMIDGPKTLERKFGYDAGLSSPFRTAMAMYAGGRVATSVASSGVGAAGGKLSEMKQSRQSNQAQSIEKSLNSSSTNSQQTTSSNSHNDSANKSNSQSHVNGNQTNNGQSNTKSENVANSESTSRGDFTQSGHNNENAQSNIQDDQTSRGSTTSENTQSSGSHSTLEEEMKENNANINQGNSEVSKPNLAQAYDQSGGEASNFDKGGFQAQEQAYQQQRINNAFGKQSGGSQTYKDVLSEQQTEKGNANSFVQPQNKQNTEANANMKPNQEQPKPTASNAMNNGGQKTPATRQGTQLTASRNQASKQSNSNYRRPSANNGSSVKSQAARPSQPSKSNQPQTKSSIPEQRIKPKR